MPTIRQIAGQRAAQMLRDDRDMATPPVVAVRTLADLERHLVHGSARIEEISRADLKAAILWRDVPDRHSIWVRAKYTSYRSAYRRFIGQAYDGVDWDGFADLDVDHILNRARLKRLDYYVRLEAVRWDINQQHGRTVEAAAGKNPREKKTGKGERPLTALSILKLAGLQAPSSPSDQAAIDAARRFLIGSQRWHPLAADQGLADMLHRAYEVR